ncbi:uncharacterized protein JCM10292_004094 [Rhodotorula paludigena]|uniref:uncharacterized protein n=1 Tax=Rhodotorula paludigena TaxID=86838 RepID=UPI00316E089B
MPDSQGADYDYRTSSVDEDRRRAKEVEKRVNDRHAAAGAGPNGTSGGGADGQRAGADSPAAQENEQAVRVIQSSYRSHVQRRTARGCNLTCSERWTEGARARRLSSAGHDQDTNKNDTASRWQRGQIFASKISEGKSRQPDQPDELSAEDEMDKLARNDKERKRINKERTAAKAMESQYWLEMVDNKHRYGSNLKYYHKRWNESDTKDNFFHWLDEGEGKHLDLEECPRKRLDSERIVYLNATQREVYRVIVNDDGLLVWAKDRSPLDTSKYHEDRGPENGGIVAISAKEYEEKQAREKEKIQAMQERGEVGDLSDSSSSSSSSSSGSSTDPADEIREGARPYGDKGGTAGQGKGVRQAKERVKYYASPRAVMDTLLRTTINKNTWLYVSDLENRLYVGIKKTGSFQHSSFLYGARVTSAGLIKANKGHLTSLSPLSGHYRAGTMHFKAFVRSLQDDGVDMSRVSISKSVLTIRGIEKYGALSKKKKRFVDRVKSAFTHNEPQSDQERDKDLEQMQRIRKEETDEGRAAHDDEVREGERELRDKKERSGQPLPGEGKSVEEMTEDERMQRGVALVLRAFERGLSMRDESSEADRKEQ